MAAIAVPLPAGRGRDSRAAHEVDKGFTTMTMTTSREDLHLLAERTDRAQLADLHAAVPAALRKELGLRLEDAGAALLSVASGVPSIVLNRVAGLGVEQPAWQELVDRLSRTYADAGVGRHFVHLHPMARPAELADWLSAAGYRRHRRWMKFVRGWEAPPAAATDLEVRRIGTEHAADFGRIVAEGFDLGDGGAGLVAALVGRPRWHVYMSFAGDEPAGTGALFVDGEIAWLDWGATTRAQRARGSQGAILARRVSDALDLGCRTMLTTTGEWVEGDPQHSYRNILRAGFQEGYLHENYVPA